MTEFLAKVARFIRTNRFFSIVVALFLLQGVVFAFVVTPSHQEFYGDFVTRGGGVVPDGNRHIATMYYYAERPLLDGPFIDDMADRYLWLGDLERFPSYFYQYLMSFPARALVGVGASDEVIVMAIRLISLLFGLVALVVFRKIALEVKAGRSVANIAALSFAMTGAFAWLSPAENYDVMAVMLYFIFILFSLRLFTRQDSTYLYGMAVSFFLLAITKYTYIPFAGLTGLAALWLFGKQLKWPRVWPTIKEQWVSGYRKLNKLKVAGLVALLLVSAGLFTERIGVNLVQYQSFNPACNKIHSHEACMRFGVYSRNYNREQKVEREPKESFSFPPVEYTKEWVGRYFSSIYGYVGHIWIHDFWRVHHIVAVTSIVVTIALLGAARVKRIKLLKTDGQRLLLAVAGIMVVAQYGFNVRTYLWSEGAFYAHQGRYLMAAVGLLYIVMLVAFSNSLKAFSGRRRRQVKNALMVFGALVLVLMGPLLSYWMHAWSGNWYSEPVRELLPGWWFEFREFIFYDLTRW